MKKLALWTGIGIVGIIGVVALAFGTPTTITPQTSSAAVVQAVTPQPTTPTSTPVSQIAPAQTIKPQIIVTPSAPETLSNDNHYTNVNGDSVQDPAYSSNGCVAAGATAECGDGTCSFSENHRGTCSHHGGVSQWLK